MPDLDELKIFSPSRIFEESSQMSAGEMKDGNEHDDLRDEHNTDLPALLAENSNRNEHGCELPSEPSHEPSPVSSQGLFGCCPWEEDEAKRLCGWIEEGLDFSGVMERILEYEAELIRSSADRITNLRMQAQFMAESLKLPADRLKQIIEGLTGEKGQLIMACREIAGQ